MKHPALYQLIRSRALPSHQRGVLLIITLIMLVVISGVAALSIKGSGSSEALANNVRTQGLAIQAAEAALRYWRYKYRPGTPGPWRNIKSPHQKFS
jgi:PilX N-terminal